MQRCLRRSCGIFGLGCDLKYSGAPTIAARWSFETRTAIMYIAQTGLREFRQGAAAAMGYILAAALILISLVNFRLFRTEEGES